MSDERPATPIRVTPRVRTRADLAVAPARLVATLLSVATAGMLDAQRFRRGREYASTGAVTSLVIGPRTLRGTVMGSRREPYEVEIHTDLVAMPAGWSSNVQALTTITPDADELHAMCSCPDAAESVCKHAAAVLLAFAEEAGDRPALLIAWRCSEDGPTERATIGSRRFGAAAGGSGGGGSGGGGSGDAAGDLAGDAPGAELDRFTARRLGERTDASSPGSPFSRRGSNPSPFERRPTSTPPSPFTTPAWLEFVAFAADLPDVDELAESLATDVSNASAGHGRPPTLPLGSERIGGFDLAAMVRSAQQAMRAASHDIL